MSEEFEARMTQAIEETGIAAIGRLSDLDALPTEKGGKLCLGLECLDRDLWEFAPAFPQIRALGVQRVRLQTGWQKTEKTKGVYDFSWLDAVVDRLLGAGVTPFLSLSYGNRLYCGDERNYPNIGNGGVGHIPVVSAEEREGWQRYVRATVEHFKDRIDHYEVWNEPDVSVFCQVNMPWPEAYMELLGLTVPVIRAACPNATVISCTARFEAIGTLLQMGLAEYADIHSFHGYTFYPEVSPGAAKANKLSHYKRLAPHLRLWRGEAGCPSYNDPKSRGALSNVAVSEIKQAKFLLRHLMGDLENDAIALTSYFHAYDFMHFSGSCRYHYGLIRHEGLSRKPSYHCFQVLTHLFDGGVRPCPAHSLAFAGKAEEGWTEAELLSLRFSCFEKKGKLIYSYYLPKPIEDAPVARSLRLTMPYTGQTMERPVILDPFTRRIYPVSDPVEFAAPVTDYPLLILDQSLLAGLAEINDYSAAAKEEKVLEQADHE